MATVITLLVIGLFSFLSFWKLNPLLFMVLAGLSMIFGLNAPDMISSNTSTTATDITVGLSLILYAFFSLAMAFRLILWEGAPEEDEE